ncbi:MAG: glycosyltransferase involved in cell wall biosynthesis [Lysobacterales bacterium]|jgi:glycosyltransferase involved in cell wall biosynthesis
MNSSSLSIDPSNNQTKKRLLTQILIIIPAYNEAESLQQLISEIKSLNKKVSILVVDDGSSDHTTSVAYDMGVKVITLPFNLGIGGAVQTGYKYAYDKGYDIAVQVDGDGQHDVTYLSKLLKPILTDQADMVIGSRFMTNELGYKSSFVRRIGIRFFSNLISFLTGNVVTDPTSGFRAVNSKLIKVFARYYPQDFPEPEAIMVAGRKEGRIMEVSVKMRPRVTGSSSIRYLKTFYYMTKVTLALLIEKLK